jgi:hypothetical protein
MKPTPLVKLTQNSFPHRTWGPEKAPRFTAKTFRYCHANY